VPDPAGADLPGQDRRDPLVFQVGSTNHCCPARFTSSSTVTTSSMGE
jgi:hypothetical protein